MVSYDRIYEADNLASEMIKGQKTDYTFLTSIKSIRNTEQNYLGHIYVKYLEPINLEKFLGAKYDQPLFGNARRAPNRFMKIHSKCVILLSESGEDVKYKV